MQAVIAPTIADAPAVIPSSSRDRHQARRSGLPLDKLGVTYGSLAATAALVVTYVV